MSLKVRVDSAGKTFLDDKPVANLQELQSLLAAEAVKDPQPQVSLQADDPKNYKAIGRVIYMVFRVGFKEENFSDVGKRPVN